MQSFSIFWAIIIYGTITCLLCVFPWTRRFYKRVFDFRVFKKTSTYFLVLLGLLIIFFANLLIFHRSISSTIYYLTSSFSQTSALSHFELISFILYTVIIAPIFEEIMFRGPLFIWIDKRSYFWVALVISSLIFGLFHGEYPLFGFVMGMVFGSAFKLSRSLLPTILIHILWNLFGLFYFNFI